MKESNQPEEFVFLTSIIVTARHGRAIYRHPAARNHKADVPREVQGPDFLQDRHLRGRRPRGGHRGDFRRGRGRYAEPISCCGELGQNSVF